MDATARLRLTEDPAYRRRVARVRSRLRAAGVTTRSVARAVGRGEVHVYNVLGLARPGRPTLERIEAHLDALAAAGTEGTLASPTSRVAGEGQP